MITTKEDLIPLFKQVEDPELHIDVWTLGLIYEYDIDQEKNVKVKMTFTTPFCPYGPELVDRIKDKIADAGGKTLDIEVTFDPPWQPSEELREMMGM
ncbi:TPA: metal-sulfur cluster assembly factor [Candidatus Woesearchaeota archaeon]|nr:aromatic ring hydroxylase [archaeon]HIJ11094.1 metal-sulfur cluster assembly factor [Candidatus Woesearchaeota archaeon]